MPGLHNLPKKRKKGCRNPFKRQFLPFLFSVDDATSQVAKLHHRQHPAPPPLPSTPLLNFGLYMQVCPNKPTNLFKMQNKHIYVTTSIEKAWKKIYIKGNLINIFKSMVLIFKSTFSNSNLLDNSLLMPLPSKVFSLWATMIGCSWRCWMMLFKSFLNSSKKIS